MPAQSLTMERDSVNKVHTTQCPQPHKPRGYNENIRPHNHNDKGKQQKRSCRNCGGQFPHTIKCPAKGKTCNFCKKHNHCSKVCRSRLKRKDFQEVKAKEAIIESSSDEEYAYTIKKKTEHVSVVSTKTPKVSLLDQKTHDRIGASKLTREKNPNLLSYGGGSSIKVMGQCKLTVETKHSINYNTFYVVEGNYGSLLGYPLATNLGLVKIINQVSDPKTTYPKLFEVIGKYNGAPIKLHK